MFARPMRILLVEDDAMLGAAVRSALAKAGHAVDWVQEGSAADLAVAGEPYDVVLLDLGLPDKSGLDVLRELRRRGLRMPVLILTAQDAVRERVAGLDAGADDCLVKPFDLDELAARIRAVQRRSVGRAEPVIEHGRLTLNPATREVFLEGAPVSLSAREFALLEYLLRHAGQVVSKTMILSHVWEYSFDPQTNIVDVLVSRLREKIDRPFEKKLLHTVRGVGYVLRP